MVELLFNETQRSGCGSVDMEFTSKLHSFGFSPMLDLGQVSLIV